jgi:hypothetical protein
LGRRSGSRRNRVRMTPALKAQGVHEER